MAAPFAIQNPADLVNYSLRSFGYGLRVGTLYDGSDAANAALDLYAQVRDATLRAGQWQFARADITMTLQKAASADGYGPWVPWDRATYPPRGWLYQYAYPDDCLKVRAVSPQPLFAMDFDPQPYVFSEDNDPTFTPAKRVILCNALNAILTYTRRVTDPATWEPNFIDLFADALGKRLAPLLKDMQAAQLIAAEEQADSRTANVTQG